MDNIRAIQFGNGKLGGHLYAHLKTYFADKILLISDREAHSNLVFKAYSPDFVFLAVKDKDIESLVLEIRKKWDTSKIIHFSGSYWNSDATGVHPVFSFSQSQQNIDFSKIKFVADGVLDRELLSLFKNIDHIHHSVKKKYHTYLSVTSNFSQLLVYMMGRNFTKFTGMDSSYLKDLLIQSLISEREAGPLSFTGPWIRGEKQIQDQEVFSSDDQLLIDLNNTFIKFIEEYKNECSKV